MIYRLIFRVVLVRLPEETAHRFAAASLRALAWFAPTRLALRAWLTPREDALRVEALGMTFPSPVGLAAGVDTNASWFEALGLLGFGFIEVGTVTAEGQIGNSGRRVARLPREHAILNRRGFPNDGAAKVAARLAGRSPSPIVGVNVGKSRTASLERAAEDYRSSLRRLAPMADYVVLNVSSPNTPGLRELQAAGALGALIDEARAELSESPRHIPLLVKVAPDVSDEGLDAIADVALARGVDGIVAVNTTVDRGVLRDSSAIPPEMTDGGISGAPLRPRAVQVLRRLRERTRGKLVLISVGGVESAEDVLERLHAGATLVQAHTAFVYGGPLWAHRVNRELSRRLRAGGRRSIREAVGDAPVTDDAAAAAEDATARADKPLASRPA